MKFIIFCFFLPVTLFSQQKNDFSLQYGISVINSNGELAKLYVDSDATYNMYNLESEERVLNSLNRGLDHTISLNYSPSKFFDIGAVSSYQSSNLVRTFAFEDFANPDDNGNYPIRNGEILNSIRAFSFGLSTNIYINRFLHFENKPGRIINNTSISIGLKGMYGKREFNEKSAIKDYTFDLRNFSYSGNSLVLRAELAFGYEFRKHFFSTIGVKIGYQYMNELGVKNYYGESLIIEDGSGAKLKLDLSGIYYGVFLRIGK